MSKGTTPFLYEVAEKLLGMGKNPDEFMVVFPNRRSILYFRKQLSGFFSKPVFGPELLTFEDFISGMVHCRIPGRLQLIYKLYQAYNQVTGWNESFDAFYFWGSMLLRDFDEMDKYLVNPDHVFRDLTNQKELDAAFDYLTDEQKKFLNEFWSGFAGTQNMHRARFRELWRRLAAVYHTFNEKLKDNNLAYEGRMYREAALHIDRMPPPVHQLVFVGFNALTPAQEKIVTHAVSHWHARVFWDIDEYYLHSEWQEAGLFFRKYKSHSVLGPTFPSDVPGHLRQPKELKIYGSPQATGQAKILAQVLQEALQKGMNPEEAVIVLPDEKMLLPVLHAVSEQVEKLNVSISYPLRLTPVTSFVELLARLQTHFSNGTFGARQVLALFSHPYLCVLLSEGHRGFLKEIIKKNQIRIPETFFRDHPILHRIFRPVPPGEIFSYITEILQIFAGQETTGRFDREYAHHALLLLSELKDIPEALGSWDVFLLIFRQLVNETRIPFVGEPLQGLPVIGMLETRNLDFRHVFMLSVNEGAIPAFGRSGSYLPYSLRQAYGLPVPGHDDAISAYLFYRIIQRASHVTLFYVTEPDELGRGEMSRFLQQLLLESEPRPNPVVVTNPLEPHPVQPISIEKTDEVWQQLLQRHKSNWRGQGLTPTALYSYLACRLQFYYKYILGIREAPQVEEDMNARIAGTILHDTIEQFYRSIISEKRSTTIQHEDLVNPDHRLQYALDVAFRKAYGMEATRAVVYEGRQLIMQKVIKHFALQIIKIDRIYAPFEILGMEQDEYRYKFKIPGTDLEAEVGGKIDRIDRKDNVVRVIDYKTGKDELKVKNLEELFARDGKQKKAEFQVLLYALLFARTDNSHAHNRIVPGIMGRMQIFKEDFQFEFTDNVNPLLDEFEARLKEMVAEIFDRRVPFSQTISLDTCEYCTFRQICHR